MIKISFEAADDKYLSPALVLIYGRSNYSHLADREVITISGRCVSTREGRFKVGRIGTIKIYFINSFIEFMVSVRKFEVYAQLK